MRAAVRESAGCDGSCGRDSEEIVMSLPSSGQGGRLHKLPSARKKLPGEVFDIAQAMARRMPAMDGGHKKTPGKSCPAWREIGVIQKSYATEIRT
jgi:hypothetical protein